MLPKPTWHWLSCGVGFLCCSVLHAVQLSHSKDNHEHKDGSEVRKAKNVLFIIADDMRPDLGAYNDSTAYTPNIDKLGREGLVFQRAYTNFAACAPSRTSLLTGRLPDMTRAFTFVNHFREPGIGENWRSLPQYFKEVGGYYTATSGKVFHAMLPPNNDYPLSWTEKPYTPDCKLKDGCPDSIAENLPIFPDHEVACKEGKLRHYSYCAADVDVDETRVEKQLVDQRTRDNCIRQLREGSMYLKSQLVKGFFVACGFHKPHLSYLFPAKFLEHYPDPNTNNFLARNTIEGHGVGDYGTRGYPFVPKNMPQIAWAETSRGLGVSRDFNATQDGDYVLLLHRAYYGAVSYIDDNIGRLLKALWDFGHKDDTLVVLTSDHSVAMGEQGTWGKMTNFESSLRVPLIMRAPWIPESRGRSTRVLAELVDLYATIADLAGLPTPESQGEHINGTSLAEVLRDASPQAETVKSDTLAQLAKPFEDYPNYRTLNIQRRDIQVMGYSVRSDLFRYTAWFRYDGPQATPRLNETLGQELYKYDEGEGEVENLVEDPEYRTAADTLHRLLVSKVRVEPFENQMVMPLHNEGE